MPSVQISVDTTAGQAKIERLLKAVEPGTILNLIGARLTSYVDESFRTRGRGQWQPLAPLTLELRKRGGDVPLQDTGRYKASYVTETDGQTFVEVGTNLKTASGISLGRIHEFGIGPYTIRVRRAKVLAAQLRSGTWMFFGKEIQHPGIPARPVLPSKVVVEKLIQETIDGMLSRISRPSAGRFGDMPAVFRSNRQ